MENKTLMVNSLERNCHMTNAEAKAEASRCLFCFDAPCQADCQAGVDVPRFVRRIMHGDIQGADQLIKADNPLAWICGVVCPTERLCASRCPRQLMDGAIRIGALQAHVSAQNRRMAGFDEPSVCLKGRVAVLGSGPAGLAAAWYLSRSGIEVCLFEAEEFPGGLITYGIPPDRLDKRRAIQEIKNVLRGPGISVRLETKVSLPHELLGQYAAVFVATGLGPERLHRNLSRFSNLYRATDFLREVNKMHLRGQVLRLNLGSEVLVIGGGNSALDAAMAARFLGVSDVTVVYRRTAKEMPAWRGELVTARQRGVSFRFLLEPISFEGDTDEISKVVFRQTKLGEPGNDGRPRIERSGGQEIVLTASAVIMATGRQRKRKLEWLKDKNVHPLSGRVGRTRMFIGGELMRGPGVAVEALRDGKQAAREIVRLLGRGASRR